MRRSLELYFLVNLTADAALLFIIARLNGCFSIRRTLLASLVSAAYAPITYRFPILSAPAAQLTLLFTVALILTHDHDFFRLCSVCFQLFCGAALTGGIGQLFPKELPALAVASGLLCLSLLLSFRRQKLTTWDVTVYLTLRGRNISFQALIDTGNRLHEPISGLPVLIVEDSLLDDLIPSGNEALHCRKIAFGALGGNGTIRCFKPDDVLIRRSGRLLQAPSVWVAIYPGKIPGSTRALAPPIFAVIRSEA